MPIYGDVNKGVPGAYDLSKEYEAPLWETFKTGLAEGFESGPWQSGKRAMKRDHFQDFADMSSEDAIAYAREWGEGPTGMDMKKQAEVIERAGLTGKVKPDPVYDEETLQEIISARADSDFRKFVLERGGFFSGLAGELAGGMADPINLAVGLVPLYSEAQAMRVLGNAGSKVGRQLARAKMGMVEGAVTAVPVEAMTLGARHFTQDDHGPMDSLLNVAGGAMLGGILRPAAGLWKEWKVAGDILKPWEVAESSAESVRRMEQHADAYYKSILDANPNLDKEKARSQAYINAAAYDLFARQISARENRPLADVYDSWRLDYGSERAAGLDGETSPVLTHVATDMDGAIREAGGLGPDKLAADVELFEKRRAVISFFSGAEKGQKELGAVLLHELERAAAAPDAHPRARALWRRIEESMGKTPGEIWTADEIDSVAKEAMKSLFRNTRGMKELAGLRPLLKDELSTLYMEAAGAGVKISPEIGRAMDGLFRQDLKANEEAFLKAVAHLAGREQERVMPYEIPARAQMSQAMTRPPVRPGQPGQAQGGQVNLTHVGRSPDPNAATAATGATANQTPAKPAADPTASADPNATPEAKTPGQTPDPAATPTATANAVPDPNAKRAASADPNATPEAKTAAPEANAAPEGRPDILADAETASQLADEKMTDLAPENLTPDETRQLIEAQQKAHDEHAALLDELEKQGVDKEMIDEMRAELAEADAECADELFLANLLDEYAMCEMG